MIPAVEVLRKKRGKKIEFSTDTCEEKLGSRGRGGGGGGGSEGKEFRRVDRDFSENYIERDRGKEFRASWPITSRRAYFAANWRAGNKLVLSSRREYLRGPYTFRWCVRA